MARKRKKVDRVHLELAQEMLISDGLEALKKLRQLIDASIRCLDAENPAFPLYTSDIKDKATYLFQLSGCHAVLANILVKR